MERFLLFGGIEGGVDISMRRVRHSIAGDYKKSSDEYPQ